MKSLFQELRPLSLPFWLSLILSAVLPLFRMLNNPALLGDAVALWGLLLMLIQLFFFCGVLLLAALPFGMDFQYHTFPLLLSQPRSRWNIWKQRTLLAGGLIAICGLAHWVGHLAVAIPWSREVVELLAGKVFLGQVSPGFNASVPLSDVSGMDLLAIFGFMMVTACTAGFWTLGGRSIIAGVVFTVAGEVGGTGLVYGLISRFTEDEGVFVLSLLIIGPAYCALLMWLGWRKFAAMQLKATAIGESTDVPLLSRIPWQPRFLHSRATNRWLNLLLKELRLQKPIFLLTALFIVCWTVVALLSRAQPVRQMVYELLLAMITIGYVSLTAILAGSIALVDEKTLGIAAWHLTFPVKAVSQWFVKLLAGLLLMALAACVPCLMLWLLPPWLAATSDLSYAQRLSMVLGVVSLVTIVSFWAATMADGIVRAAIVTVAAFALLSAFGALGIWSADQFSGLETSVLKVYLWPLLSDEDVRNGVLERFSILSVLTILALLLLRRSFLQFRHAQLPARSTLRWAVLMLLFSAASGVWWADVIKTVQRGLAGY
jgi:hypothetical protein